MSTLCLPPELPPFGPGPLEGVSVLRCGWRLCAAARDGYAPMSHKCIIRNRRRRHGCDRLRKRQRIMTLGGRKALGRAPRLAPGQHAGNHVLEPRRRRRPRCLVAPIPNNIHTRVAGVGKVWPKFPDVAQVWFKLANLKHNLANLGRAWSPSGTLGRFRANLLARCRQIMPTWSR